MKPKKTKLHPVLFCNTKIEDSDVIYCPECGKSVEIDKQSFEGTKTTINMKMLIIFS